MKDVYQFISDKEDETGLLFNKWSLDQLATYVNEYTESKLNNNEVLDDVIGLLPIGTKVTILNDAATYAENAGLDKKITGYCEWNKKPQGGYECDEEGIFLLEDFQEYQ